MNGFEEWKPRHKQKKNKKFDEHKIKLKKKREENERVLFLAEW